MELVNEEKVDKSDRQVVKTKSVFTKTMEGFDGTISTFDAFFLQKVLTINLKVKEFQCVESNMRLVQFRISPKPFEDEVWNSFNDIKLKVMCK